MSHPLRMKFPAQMSPSHTGLHTYRSAIIFPSFASFFSTIFVHSWQYFTYSFVCLSTYSSCLPLRFGSTKTRALLFPLTGHLEQIPAHSSVLYWWLSGSHRQGATRNKVVRWTNIPHRNLQWIPICLDRKFRFTIQNLHPGKDCLSWHSFKTANPSQA